jgi:HME family heavy-metal exporter
MFKWLLDNSLTNRLLVIIASVVLMAYGAFTLSRTPVDVFPDLNKPTVTIMTEAGGMAAEEVEQLITFPLETTHERPARRGERALDLSRRPVLHLRHLRLEHRHLPRPADGVGAPVVDGGRHAQGVVPRMGPISSIMGEIMQIAIPIDRQDQPDGRARVRRLGAAPAPDGGPGVAQVIPIGGEVRQFQVQPDTARMAELGITHDQLEGALKGFRPTPRAASWS